MPDAPYCKVTYSTCRNPDCGRIIVVVARRGCEKCRRCRRDGYCSFKCRCDAQAAKKAKTAKLPRLAIHRKVQRVENSSLSRD